MIIGVTGWFCSGKDTVADYLTKKYGFKSISLGDLIREDLKKDGIELTRDNLRKRGNELRAKYGPGHLAEVAIARLKKEGVKNAVFPATRQPGEVLAMKKEDDAEIWEVRAPIELRFARMLQRGKETSRKEDLEIKSVEDLIEKERQERSSDKNAQQIDKVIEMADRVIKNTGSLEDLHKQIDNLLSGFKL